MPEVATKVFNLAHLTALENVKECIAFEFFTAFPTDKESQEVPVFPL